MLSYSIFETRNPQAGPPSGSRSCLNTLAVLPRSLRRHSALAPRAGLPPPPGAPAPALPRANNVVPAPPSLVPLQRDYGALERSQYRLFVQFFRQASPYIEGHRGRTFVVAVPGEVVDCKPQLHALLEDVALLHGLGVKLVVVIGARTQIEQAILASGSTPKYVSGLRVTDGPALAAAIQAAGAARMEVEGRLSKGPAVPMLRRHTRGGAADGSTPPPRGLPALATVSGNYVLAKRKGVVAGVDYQHTGVVRFVQSEAVRRQLDSGNVVLLSNLGYSAAGEVLNCDTYTVAARAAVDLQADKLIVVTSTESSGFTDAGAGGDVLAGLPQWLALHDAEAMLRQLADGSVVDSLTEELERGERLLALVALCWVLLSFISLDQVPRGSHVLTCPSAALKFSSLYFFLFTPFPDRMISLQLQDLPLAAVTPSQLLSAALPPAGS
jgi:acetylglutamate kinase